jgi:YD repeat-containing protein
MKSMRNMRRVLNVCLFEKVGHFCSRFGLMMRIMAYCSFLMIANAIHSQGTSISTPDNALTRIDVSSLPPGASALGDFEQVDLSTSSLNMFIPAVTLKQRGGWDLPLGFVYSSNVWMPIMNIGVTSGSTVVEGTNQVTTEDYDIIDYTPSVGPIDTFTAGSFLHANLPHLTASEEYNGDIVGGSLGGGYSLNAEWCLTNWAFTDFSGATHTFDSQVGVFKRDCHLAGGISGVHCVYGNCIMTTPDSPSRDFDDGAHYTLDVSDHSDMRVTGPDGFIYHFGPYPNTASTTGPGLSSQYEGFISSAVTKVDIPNGDSISISKDTTGYTLTDTLGHLAKIGLYLDSISYTDSNGQAQSVSIEGGDAASLTNISNPVPTGYADFKAEYSTRTLVSGGAPTSEVYIDAYRDGNDWTPSLIGYNVIFSSTNKKYRMGFDQNGRMLYVGYPSGGYRRYDWEEYEFNRTGGAGSIASVQSKVTAQHDCTRSNGGCSLSDEYTKKYTSISSGLAWLCPSQSLPWAPGVYMNNCGRYGVDNGQNQQMLVQDDEKHVLHEFAYLGFPGRGASEVRTSVSDSAGNMLQVTTFYYLSSLKYGTINDSTVYSWWPLWEVTSSYDGSGAPLNTSKKGYQWDSVSSSLIHQPVEIDDYDFGASSWTKSVTQQWTHISHIYNRLGSRTVTDASSGYSSTETYDYDVSGNEKSVTKTGSNATTQSITFTPLDTYGRPTQAVDGLQHSTSYDYSDSWYDSTCAPSSDSRSYLTKVTNALKQTTSYSYYSCTGALGKVTYPDGKSTTYGYDSVGRITSIRYPDGGSVQNIYSDSAPNMVQTTKAMNSSENMISIITKDGFSRTIKSELTVPSGNIYTDTTYDSMGRIASVSNPYKDGELSHGVTQYFYDSLGRKTEQIASDGKSESWWCYDNKQDVLHPQPNCHSNQSSLSNVSWVDQRDENSNDRQSTSDALERLMGIVEPGSLETDYAYDSFNDLVSVMQKGGGGSLAPNRSFSYNGLSQLITSANPEVGTVCYGTMNGGTCAQGYDANGNLRNKTDARGVVITYTYDALNRLTSKVYSDSVTPISCYQYDSSSVTNGIGRLANAWTQPAGTTCGSSPASGSYLSLKSITAYDAMGRPTNATQQQCIGTKCTAATPYSLSMAYDLAGNMTSLTNSVGAKGSSLSLGTSYDAAARPCLATSNWSFPNSSGTATTPLTLFQTDSSDGYAAFGGLQHWYMGSTASDASSACGGSVSTPITIQQTYTNRLWPKSITATGQMP